ncbi:MAG TPA: tetratricopeptide repeat protein, partial [Coleofasciculaceae cyanobacterium]
MFYRFRPLSLATSMLLAVFPLIPLTLNLESVVVQAQTTESTQAESVRLNQEGLEQFNNGQFQAALENFRQALVIVRKIGERQSEGSILNNMGGVYYNLGQYAKALEFYQPALAIKQEFGDKAGEGQTLNNLGGVYHKLGQYTLALASYQQALVVREELDDKAGIAQTLNNLAGVYRSLGQYPLALERYQQALAIRRELDDKAGIAQTLNNVGVIHHKGEQYAKALEFYQQALTIHRELNNKAGEGAILSNIGLIYDTLGQYAKALEFYQQALAIHTEIGDKELGDRAGEEVALNNIGLIHHKLGEYSQALKFYQHALAISREIRDRANEATNLSNIGVLLETQNQPELAIVFYKQSVNVTEAIRDELRGLPFDQQKSFIQTVSGRYRRLADLLLKQDRVLEAQQVLDLLKVQELDDYLNTVRGNPHTRAGIDYLPSEQQIVAAQNARLAQIVQLGKELSTLQGIAASDRTLQQEQRRREIEAAQQELMRDYLDFIRSPQIVTLVEQLTRTTGGENLNPKLLKNLQDNLKQVGQDAVLLYPLILENRLELVLVTPYAPPIRRSVPVNRSDLNRAIAEFRSTLTKPVYNAKKPAQQLYNWLIQPIEAALTEANAKVIIYAPDGQLRYIPLAALHDGNQWLVQKYRINNITALSLTEWEKKPQAVKILAGAFSEGNYSFQVGDRTFSLGGLPFA